MTNVEVPTISPRHELRGTYQTWINMKNRCNNPANVDYHNYGGRGISYEPRWDKFIHFLVDMGKRPAHLTLDRRDNNLGYSKSNCRWATRLEQIHNRRCSSKYKKLEK